MPLSSKDRIDYNFQSILSGGVKPSDLSWFVTQGQLVLGVEPDGRMGPDTMAALWGKLNERKRALTPVPQSLGMRALACAISDIGKGEEGGNNVGLYVSMLRTESGLSWSKGPWCAVACSAWLVRAAKPMPSLVAASASAKTLFDNACLMEGARVISIPEPGALICWKRRNALGIAIGHHIAFVEKFDAEWNRLHTVDGNRNQRGQRFARVDRFQHPQGSWERDLVGMVAL